MNITRHLPGLALRDQKGNVPFYRGQVTYASERIQWVTTNHPEHKLVYLIGETYLYLCPKCRISVWEAEVTMRGRRTCAFCETRVLAASPGDWLKLHYRYHPQAEYGQWWAEFADPSGMRL